MLYGHRNQWRLQAVRRTLFVVGADEALVFHAVVGRAIARRECRRLDGRLAAGLEDVQ